MRILSLLFTVVVSVVAFAQVPTITSFSPTSGPVGTTVTITGTGFNATAANNIVFFGGSKATVSSATTTSITVTVPAAANSLNSIQIINTGSTKTCISTTQFNTTYVGGVVSTSDVAQHFATSSTSAVGPSLSGDGTAYSYSGMKTSHGDFDNDGDIDIVFRGASANGALKVFKNIWTTGSISSSTFTATDLTISTPTVSSQTVGIIDAMIYQSVDINLDGKVDIIGGGPHDLVVLKNNSSGSTISFTEQSIYNETWVAHSRFKVADLNADGLLDIVTVGAGGVIHVFECANASTLAFTHTTISTASNYYAMDVELADMNNDGKNDIVVYSYTYTGYLGKISQVINNSSTSVSFSTLTDIASGQSTGNYSLWGGLTVFDFDGNGFKDIAFCKSGASGPASVLFAISQNSSNVFSSPFAIGSYTSNSEMPNKLISTDINGDGKIDIVGWGNNSAGVFAVLNKHSSGTLSASSFGTKTNINWGGDIEGFVLADFNKDGKVDVIHQNYYNNNVTFYQNIPPVAPTINTHPSLTSSSICTMVSSGTMSITATGASTYQWQISSNSGSSWADITGATSATFTGMNMDNPGTFLFRCIAISSLGAGTPSNSVSLTVNGSTFTTQPTTTAINICHNATPQSLTVATSASSPTFVWQQSTNGTSGWSDATTATGYQTTTMTPSHAEINWGVRYYRCVVTSGGCSTPSNSSAAYSIINLTQSAQPSTTARNYCLNGTAINLSVSASAMGSTITYIWQSATTPTGSYANVVGGSGASTNTYTPPTNVAGTLYYRCYYQFCGGYSQASNASGAITVSDTYTWNGSSSTSTSTAANWTPNVVPCAGMNIIIPSGAPNYPSYSNLTINAGSTFTVQSGGRLTVTGTLTNNGTLTIESGATFLQGTSLAGSGTYNVKQTVTNCSNDGSVPTGRYWYMGVPINSLTRGSAFGTASNLNRLWSWSETAQAWSSQITDATALTPTTGYVFRTGTNTTLTFSGTSLYSANPTLTGLTNTTGSFDGCHLISNPYTAYLDWEAMIAAAGTTNLATTMCVRSYNTSSSQMVYDTYNATGDVAVQNSSYAVTRYIAPMQSFWITVNPSTTGTLSMTKAMLTHQPTAPGLKDLTSFPAFARLNLVDGSFTDQVVVYTDAEANAELEAFDSKKFFLPNVAQVYCKVGNDKLVINALKKGKAQTSAPLTVELPTTKVYKFEMAESFVESGLVILEDRQEGIFQDMGINPTYEFFGNSGVIADRFVLHFQLPNGASNEGQAGVEDLTSSQIAVISNPNGSILVSLSADLTATGEVQVLDAAGRLIQTTAIKGQDTKLQITEGTGVYFVRVSTPMKSETKKVLVY